MRGMQKWFTIVVAAAAVIVSLDQLRRALGDL